MAGTASLKRHKPTVICSFRKSALLVEVPRGIAADRDTAVHTVTPTRTASIQMMNGFVEINTFIHSAPKQKSDEWMHLSPIYTRVHGEWLRYAKSTSLYSLVFSLKVRDDWGSQVNSLCHHDITRSDRQIGNCGIKTHTLLQKNGQVQNKVLFCSSTSFQKVQI